MRTPKKTAARKGARKPTQLHRSPETRKKPTIADDLHVLKESFEAQAYFLIDWRKRSEDRIAAMETNVERWLKGYHEDTIAQIEANRAMFIRLESRLPAPPNSTNP